MLVSPGQYDNHYLNFGTVIRSSSRPRTDGIMFNAREFDFMVPASKTRVGNSLKYIESRLDLRLYMNNLLFSHN